MKKNYFTKDGVEVKVSMYLSENTTCCPSQWGERPSYYMGLVGGTYGGFSIYDTIVHKAWLVSYDMESKKRDGRELVLMWRSRKPQEPEITLTSMMSELKDPVQVMAEKVCEIVTREDQSLEEMMEMAIGKINFNELSSDWWW